MLVIMIALTVFSAALTGAANAQELTAAEIVRKANDVINQETIFAEVEMTIVTTSGQTRTLYYDMWSKDHGEKSLIRYTAPRRVQDQAILMRNNADDIWSYFPRTNRVRKLASHARKQKMQGSDFAYEDMGAGDAFINDFTHSTLGEEEKEGHDCYKIELTVKEGVTSNYSRMIAWVDKESYVIWVIDYYDENDPELNTKRMTQHDLQKIDGVPTPMRIVMHNLLDGTETVQKMSGVQYNIDIPDEKFTERGLRK